MSFPKIATDSIDEVVACVKMRLHAVKTQNRAPRRLVERITACAQNRESNIAQLLQCSLEAWFLAVIVFDDEAALLNLIKGFSRADIGVLAQRLDNLYHSDQYLSDYFQHTFHTSQRAKERQNALTTNGFSSSIPSSIRLSKRLRPEEPGLDNSGRPSCVRRVGSPSSKMNFIPFSMPRETPPQAQTSGAIVAPPIEAPHEDYRIHLWPKASALPTLFPSRMCDGIIKDDNFACITSSYPRDGAQCSLDIDVTKEMTAILARELFAVSIRYDGETGRWLIEFGNGTDAWVEGYLQMECAHEPSIQRLLGNLIHSAIQNSPQRLRELEKGEILTHLLALSVSADHGAPSQLRVLLDEEMLGELTQQLWLPSTTSP